MKRNKEDVEKKLAGMLSGNTNAIPKLPDFKFCITTFALQASIFLGAIENPLTHIKEENLPQAKLIMDTLDMLKQKTEGNLLSEEAVLLDNLLCELKTQYIAKTNK